MDYEDELDRMQNRKRRGNGNRKVNDRSRDTGPQILAGQDRIYQNPGNGRNPRAQYTPQPSMVRQRLDEERAIKKRKKRRFRSIVIGISLLIIILGGAYLFLGQKTHQKGYWTIAVFGVDSRDGNLEKGALSDVEMVCSINKENGEIRLLSVYRDTYLKINKEGKYHKINEAYFKGGHEQAIDALNENLDIKIDDYATFNWKAVAQAINILGGVDIEITDAEFAYINGFITETVNSTGIGSYQLEHAGMNHLDGIQAVSYARLRLMDTDFNRTERQRKVVSLALEKAKQADFDTLKTLILTVLPQISTSIGVDDLIPLAKGVNSYHLGETAGFPFSRVTKRIGKLDCVIATTLESNVVQLHQFLYGVENFTPSQTVKSISAKISEVSGITDPGKNAPTGGSGSGKKPAKAPETQAITESAAEFTETEEASEMDNSFIEETSEAETEEQTEEQTDESGGIIGPGANLDQTGETSVSKEEKPDNGPGSESLQPSETPGIKEPGDQTQDGGPDAGPTGEPSNPTTTEEKPAGPEAEGPGM